MAIGAVAHPLQRRPVMGASHLATRIAVPVLVIVLGAAPSWAVTPDELAALSKEGLGDEVLIALIDASGLSAVVDATRALQLKRQGVSDRVIAAAIRASALPPSQPDPYPYPPVEYESGPQVPHSTAPDVVEREVYREVYYMPWVVGHVPVGHRGKARPYLPGQHRLRQFINPPVNVPHDTSSKPRR